MHARALQLALMIYCARWYVYGRADAETAADTNTHNDST